MNDVSMIPTTRASAAAAAINNNERLMPHIIPSTLQSGNIRIHDRRTSVRLEPEMWRAMDEIAALEGCQVYDLCAAVHDKKKPGTSFTAALRVFMMEYYRSASQAGREMQKQMRAGQAGIYHETPTNDAA